MAWSRPCPAGGVGISAKGAFCPAGPHMAGAAGSDAPFMPVARPGTDTRRTGRQDGKDRPGRNLSREQSAKRKRPF
ncbi:hypothetical protein Geu3261_0031_029 [Komagataeibacter europaeus NBRC 3261]|uniref:Uncharacterized protein n=1 Tax=Komagataeibacter europaeus NBRC 3261 TaxID=1234669 RepID=A0A0D6PWR1_KOMEU|nr:hypothetical protein Geu3261_0031_029 [Komagataeibacter europaeus NBRC 3261]